ncbi:MAG TPA: ABC transporter ATP-binding protein [Candidatus Ozemobacteraceae bacterium]|nr:ABC transporter ATP-binding protein [Candidatus Ozemobacteraceae bacterium]HQG27052.1 ABC transporter ATP-binding protein [Candidatus Ozemobacteraceae bacterium]
MIEFREVSAVVGSFRLDSISLKIPRGDCHVIVGPTGAGKTFLLETLIGLRSPETGSILLEGREITGVPPHRRRIAFVPQDTCLFPTMTVRDNILYGVRANAIDPAEVAPFLDHLVEFLRIGNLLDRWPQNLSGGEKQRVALARALVTKPVLLVLDEPFSAIDHSFREEIRRLLKSLLEEFRMTTLIVTHDHDEAFFLGNHISIMMDGRILQSGSRDDIYSYPRSFAAASFFGIKNVFPGKVLEITETGVTLLWEDIRQTVAVPCRCRQKYAAGQAVHFGIRPEAVYVMRADRRQDDKQNVFPGTISKIFLRGKMHTLLVETGSETKVQIEIDIHDAAIRKMGLRESMEIRISLEPKGIFLISG